MNKTVNRSSSGFMIIELIVALVVLSLIIRPVVVQQEDAQGNLTSQLQWQLPIADMLAQLGNFEKLIDQTWAGMDRKFGYTGSHSATTGKLMRETLQNGVVLMTAGFVDRQGRISGNINDNLPNFDAASRGFVTAFNDAARAGMAR